MTVTTSLSRMRMIYSINLKLRPNVLLGRNRLYSFVFLPGGHSAPDMPLLFIQVQYLPHLSIKSGIILRKTLLQVLMDGGFGDAKVFCGSADSCAVFDDVHSQFAGSLLDGIYHGIPSDAVCCQQTLCKCIEGYAPLDRFTARQYNTNKKKFTSYLLDFFVCILYNDVIARKKGRTHMNIDSKTLRRILLQVFLGVAGCILLYWLLHETERVKSVWNFIIKIISPFIIGSGLAFVLNVPMRGIERWFGKVKKKSLRRSVSIVLTFVFLGLVLYIVFRLLLPQIIETIQNLVERLPIFLNDIYDRFNSFLADHPQAMEWLSENTKFEEINWSEYIQKAVGLASESVTVIVSSVFGMIGTLFTGIFNAVIALVFCIYCLARKEILARQFRRMAYSFLPERFCDKSVRILRLTNATFSNFISGQCVEACILGSLFAIAMSIFRMPYIPLICVLIAVTALIPIVGAFVGCVLGAFFILVNDPLQAVWFVIMFLALQQFENNVIYPKVVGKSVGLPGMWVLLAVTVGGELFGVAGMLLMIPLVSVLYSLLREITAKRLDTRCIDNSKLQDQPSPVRNRLVDSHKRAKEKRLFRKKSAEVKKARVEGENNEN